ncbi:MAG: aminoacyl-tRNA hydrolase [Deltaproteobacteria bacterium]|nr:aminoacyl-tRNA hydrolase [Deltaproteobacteria bacterium]
MKLIVGLGNPGARYQFTRHNMGFLVLDQLARELDIPVSQKGFDSYFGKGKIGRTPLFLAKPQIYMNLSGIAVKKIVDYFKTDIKNLIIIHDDLDLPFEVIRIKAGGGHGGHKGLISIIDHLGADFTRIRLGIGKPLRKTMVEDYVLSPFNGDEMARLSRLTSIAGEAVREVVSSGIQAARQKFNRRAIENLIKEA